MEKKQPIAGEKAEKESKISFVDLSDLEDNFSQCLKKLHFLRNVIVEDIDFHEDALEGLRFVFCETHDQFTDVYNKFCSLHRIV